ncbi:sensor domain-containing diguanylate cyclase [Paenibacillus jilunlii]|uniref:Diguanylate cyclase n=1 Tax=Paenibacillus jilunlii TaxID=682956 RepID=A0A1G9PGN2_9BACL|nr:sensor domain-containing diguanylate cyclase [Paenibacillus jilunlii]KWX70664.1 diguanylate cyclase [Paenibacillus jilunlii]SDL97966.1 diguanylate cyclase (GGDEF) domain-containing protein [Paenibacillus jilunlii]
MHIQRKPGRRRRKKLSLTSLFTGLVTLVVLLTSTIIMVGSYDSKKQSLMETTLHLNFSNADRMARTMDSLFQSIRGSLAHNAQMLSNVEAMAPEQVNHQLELMRYSSNYFNSIIVISKDGVVRNLEPSAIGTPGKHISSEAAKKALELKQPYISAPYMTKNTNRLIVFLSQPIFSNDGTYLGILGGTIYLQEDNVLSRIFGNNNVDELGSYYYIVDSGGHLLYHPDKRLFGKDISGNRVVQKLMKGQSGEQQVRSLNGKELLAGYSSVPESGWGIVVVSPTGPISQELTRHIETIIAYSLIPFIILLSAVIFVAHRLARPFVYLADLVSKMGKEKIVLPPAKPHWSREADLLTKAVFLAVADIQKQTDQLTQEAATDTLTGLKNRRSLEYTLSQWMASGIPFSLIVLDVDRFKFVNDTYGHVTGDEVLKHVAGVIVSSLRPDDVCHRFGGEEFVILLARTRPAEAFNVAERVRRALEQRKGPIPTQVTVSQGIAHYPQHASEQAELLKKADQALYRAKSNGRNRTMVAEDNPAAPSA